MKLKTIIFLSVCPVFFVLVGCKQNKPVQIGTETSRQLGYAVSSPLFAVMLPDSISIPILWEENFALNVLFLSDNSFITEGDTIAFGVDPFYILEKQRLEMSLAMAEASNNFSSIDSLQYLLEDSSAYYSILSSEEGLIEYKVLVDETIQPADTIALITSSPPDSTYFLIPDFEQISSSFTIPGATVTEEGISFLGLPPTGKVSLPEIWEVKSNLVYENNLNSFLVSVQNDTISVSIIGFTDSTRVLFTTVSLDSLPLLFW